MFTDLTEQVRIRTPADVQRAATAFRDMALRVADMRVATCHNIALKEPMIDGDGAVLASEVFGWTDRASRWWKSGDIALESPLPIACRYESEPFWLNALAIRTRQPNPFLDAVDLSDFERRAMTRAAIVVPVHLPFAQIGAVSFNPMDPGVVDLAEPFAAHGELFDALSRVFISSYVRIMCRCQRVPIASKLSKREVECLRWAAIGKTDNEIGMIMSRSRATIRFHIHNAALKLDAVNRSQTVFKAAQLGFIGLNR